MNKAEFLDLVSRFTQRPMPATTGRHVYLWHGLIAELLHAVPSSAQVQLNLHQIASTLTRSPRAREDAGRLLRQALQTAIDQSIAPDRQQVLFVTGCDLLSRYRMPLRLFYEQASERCMVIFAVSPNETGFRPVQVLPAYVHLKPAATFHYLREVVGEHATIETSRGTL